MCCATRLCTVFASVMLLFALFHSISSHIDRSALLRYREEHRYAYDTLVSIANETQCRLLTKYNISCDRSKG